MKRFVRIEASAGGGKTSRLVDRYIELLEKGIKFNRILAITFTNKASEEMKKRILKRLKELALSGDELALSILDGRDGIIQNFSDFSVKTIDAFLFSLLKSCALDLNIPPEPEMEEEFEEILREIVEQIIVDAGSNSLLKRKILSFLRFLAEKSNSLNPRDRIIDYSKSFLDTEQLMPDGNYIFEAGELKEIFNTIKQRLERKKKEDGILFLSDISPLMFQYIRTSEIPYLLYKLGEKFYHYLIDEFQDTSLIQWESLKPLILNALAGADEEGNKGTFFYVGDPKQSIYRWRGTRWELFKTIHSEFKENLSPEEFNFIYIEENKRSAPVIVDFVNNLFTEENLRKYFRVISEKKKNYLSYFNEVEKVYENVIQRPRNGWNYSGYVEIKVIEEKKGKAEDEIFSYLENLLDDLINRRKRKFGDIAILERMNGDCERVVNFLLSKGYPVYTSYDVSIENLPLIKTIMYFFKILVNENDTLSFLNLTQTDFFKKLFEAPEEKIKEFLFSESRSVKEFSRLFPDFGKIYSYFKKLSKIFSPYYLLLEFDRVFKIGKRFREEYLQFLSLLKGIAEEAENISIYDFVKKFEKSPYLFSPSSKNAINVLTVHKAKGLEFNVVISLFTSISRFPDREKFFVYDKDSEKPELFLKNLSGKHEKEYHEAFNIIQELNLLYVALTRAKEELYFVVNNQNKKSWGMFIMESFKQKFEGKDVLKIGEKMIFEEKKAEEKEFSWERGEPVSVIDLSKKIFIKSESESEIMIHNEVLRGEWIHLVLSKIKNLKEENFDKEIERAYEKARAEWELYKVFQRDSLEDIAYFKEKLKKDFLKKFFFTDKKVNTEFDVIDEKGNTYRIDRIIFDDVIKIIEFKTGQEKDNSHIKQLKNYVDIIKEIYDKEIKGYLVYLDMEEVHEI